METNEVFQSLVNYGAEAPFWALVKSRLPDTLRAKVLQLTSW